MVNVSHMTIRQHATIRPFSIHHSQFPILHSSLLTRSRSMNRIRRATDITNARRG